MCTNATVFNFLHNRSGFANSWKSIAPAAENAPPQTSSKTDGNLTVLTKKVRLLQMESPLFFNARARFCHEGLWDTIWASFGHLPDAPRTRLGRASDASRTLSGRSSKAFSGLSGRSSGRFPRPSIRTHRAASRTSPGLPGTRLPDDSRSLDTRK